MPSYTYAEEYADAIEAIRRAEDDEAIGAVLDRFYNAAHEHGYESAVEEIETDAAAAEPVTASYETGYDDGVKAYAPWKVLGAVHHPGDKGEAYRLGFEAGWAAEARSVA